MTLLLFIAMMVQAFIPPIPAEALVIIFSLDHSILETTFFAGSGLLAGSLLCALLGRLSLPWLSRFFKKEKISSLSQLIEQHKYLLLTIRTLPYNPSDLISYISGHMRISPVRLVGMTIVTSYTRCFLLALLGSSIQGYGSFLMIASIFLISALIAKNLLSEKKGIFQGRILATPHIALTILTHMHRLDPLTILFNSKVYYLKDQTLVCFCSIKQWGKYLELGTVYTSPKFRGKGYMRRLLSHVLSKNTFVMCDQELRGFYERFGFVSLANPPAWFSVRRDIFNALLRPILGYKLVVMLKENRS